MYCNKGIDAVETYQRNLGSAKEGLWEKELKDIDKYNEVMEHYEQAARVYLKVKNIKVRVSLIDKHLKAYFSFPNRIEVKNEPKKSSFDFVPVDKVIQSIATDQKILKHLEDENDKLKELTWMAKEIFPRNSLGYIYGAISVRNAYLLSEAGRKPGNIAEVSEVHKILESRCPNLEGLALLVRNDLVRIEEYEKVKGMNTP